MHTSEKAGAAIFRYLFHSSPSEATIFDPKTASTTYSSTGLGNLAREVVTSYGPRSRALNNSRQGRPYFDSARICEVYDAFRPRKCGDLPVHYISQRTANSRRLTRAIASCPPLAKSARERGSDTFPFPDETGVP
jgi:hypothetical protein